MADNPQRSTGLITRALLALLLATALPGASWAQAPRKPPVIESPKFDIGRFVFDGATLVPREELEERTRPFTGKDRTFADVQRALEVVERTYSAAGWSAVQIILPEQELDRGEVRFRVIEARIGRVLVEGNKFFTEANVRASVPALQPGESPNIDAIARNLRVANESPSKQTTVLLRSGQEEATVDAVLRVVDERPFRTSVTVDNTGTPQTGKIRVGFGLQSSNMFGRDHVLSLQYVTAPYGDAIDSSGAAHRFSLQPSRKVFVLGAGYRIPLYARGDTLDFTVGYSNVNSGVVANLFSISGVGGIFGARYTHHLERRGDYEHRISFSFDHRGYQNKGVRPVTGTTQLIPDVTAHPLSTQYTGVIRRRDSDTTFSFGVVQNFPGGNDGRGDAFCGSRNNGLGFCANGRYFITRWSLNHNLALPGDWQWRFAMNGQQTRDMLISGEQFGLGGQDSVRGFVEREITNDVGYRGTLELYSPDIGGKTGIAGARARILGFVDWGGLKRNRPAPGEAHGQHVGSIGMGLRFARGTNMTLRLDYAVVFDQGGIQGSGEGRMHATFSYVF